MKNDINNKEFDIEQQIKKLGLDEPSSSFTEGVMHSIVNACQPEVKKAPISTLWLLLIIPFAAISVWIISLRYDTSSSVLQSWNNTLNYLLQIKVFLTYMLDKISHISVSPLVLAGLIAAIMLLTIDELFNKRNILHRKAFPKG